MLIENFKSGTMEKWGFTPEWFEANAPKVVHCSITGYGDDGPKGGMPGYDFLLQAESGLMSITGEEKGAPQKLGVAIVDVCTGQYAAISILAALRSVTETGRGQREHPPLLGEHTHEVLDGVLGIGSEDIQTLEDNGVINKKSF